MKDFALYTENGDEYTGDPLIPWTVSSGSETMEPNMGYITDNISQVVLTLPVSAKIGDVVYICGKGAGGWKVAQNAGQTIHIGPTSTLTGAGGYIESLHYTDGITLLCITNDTNWKMIWSTGNVNICVS